MMWLIWVMFVAVDDAGVMTIGKERDRKRAERKGEILLGARDY